MTSSNSGITDLQNVIATEVRQHCLVFGYLVGSKVNASFAFLQNSSCVYGQSCRADATT